MTDTTTQTSDAEVLSRAAQSRLKSFIERLERLEEDRQAIAADTKEVFSELKGEGFDPKVVRAVLKYRRQDAAARQEMDALTDLYLSAIGEV